MHDSHDQQQALPGIGLGGPYLSMAVLCEKVLREADGVLTIIRAVDRIIVSASPAAAAGGVNAPAEMPPIPINLTAVISFKSGFARGAYTVKLKMISPSHRELSSFEMPMLLEGEDRGANMVLNFGFQAQEEGLYWFEVFLLETLVTKIPLRVMYQRVAVSH